MSSNSPALGVIKDANGMYTPLPGNYEDDPAAADAQNKRGHTPNSYINSDSRAPNMFNADPSKFLYGDSTTGAADAMQHYRDLAGSSSREMINGASGLMGGQTSRYDTAAMELLRNQATGMTSSAAQLQSQGSTNDALASQQAVARSARGPAGLAMANYNMGANRGSIMQGGAAQNQMLGAQGQAASASLYANMQQDQGNLNLKAQGLGINALNQGNDLAQAYHSAEANVGTQQTQALMAQQGLQADAYNSALGYKGQENAAAYQVQGQNIGTGLGAASGAAQGLDIAIRRKKQEDQGY